MLSYHFVLIIIAFSILGIGIGQLIYSRYFERINQSLKQWYAILPVSLLLTYFFLLLLPGIPFLSTSNLDILAFGLFSILPFIAIGIIYAQIIQDNKYQISLFYCFDLLGAAAGAFLSVFLLNSLNLSMVVGIAGLLLLLAFLIEVTKGKYIRKVNGLQLP